MMLMDKGYYDYDYSEPKPKVKHEIKPRTVKQVSSTLERFGFKTELKGAEPERLTPGQLQAQVMGEENSKHGHN